MVGSQEMNAYEIVRDRRGIFIIMVLAFAVTFLDGLDSSIVIFSLPSISQEFGVSPSSASWITNAYIIGIAAPLIAFTKLADRGKTKEMFVYGTIIFTVTSFICSINGVPFFVFCFLRFVQGLGASMMGAAAPIMIIRMLSPDMRARGMSSLAMATGVSLILGPSVGSLITTFIGWRFIFLVNVPLGIIIALAGLKFIQKSKISTKNIHLDITSIVYTVLFISFGLICLQNIVEPNIELWIVVFLGGLSVLFFVLAVIRFRNDDVKNQIINVNLFGNREFLLVSFSFFLTTMLSAGSQYMLPFFFEKSCGYDSIQSGLMLTTISIFTVIASLFAGKWCDTKGCRTPVVLAIILRIVFSSLFLFMVPEWGIVPFIVILAIMGLSFGISGSSQPTRIIQHANKECQGDASAVLAEVNYVGSSLGIILFALIFTLVSIQYPEVSTDSLAVVTESIHIAGIAGILLSISALVCTLAVRNIIPGHDE